MNLFDGLFVTMGRKIISVLLLAVILNVCSQDRGQNQTSSPIPVTIGHACESLATLVPIAHEKGFFVQQGLDVTLKEYAGGKQALINGLFAGEVDIATVADIPIVFSSLERNDFRILATIGSSDNEPRIIARKDRGISKPADLIGKRIYTKENSAVHYFLNLFLLFEYLSPQDADIQFVPSGKTMVELITTGEADAFSHREPFISEARTILGDNAIIFEKPGIYNKTFNLVSFEKYTRNNSSTVEKVLSALLAAEAFTKNNPEEAFAICVNSTGSTRESIRDLWSEIELGVALQQSLILYFEDQARWILNSRESNSIVPNYLGYLYTDALDAVDSTRITIIEYEKHHY